MISAATSGRQVLGEGGDVERKHDLAAHRVHVGHGVGGGDGAVLPGVIDERGEEVEGGDDGRALVDAVDGSIVRHPKPGDEVGVLGGIERGGQRRQHLRQGLRALPWTLSRRSRSDR